MKILITNASVDNFNKTNLLFPNSLNVMRADLQRLGLVTYKRLSAMDVTIGENGEEKGNKLYTHSIKLQLPPNILTRLVMYQDKITNESKI
jgi:hypothetical protein